MDIGRALTFYTEDPRWKEKLAIGTGVVLVSTLLSAILIGIVGFAIVTGYIIRLVQNVRDGANEVLPEWDQWGDDMVRGLKYFLVMLVWAIPIFFLLVPTIVGSAISESGGDAAGALGGLLIFCGTCLVFIYSLLLSIMTPGITIWFAKTEEFSSGLQIGPIWSWTREHIGEVIIVTILVWVASFVIPLVALLAGLLLCLIGLIVTLPLGTLVLYLFQYHLYGQLAATAGGGGASTVAPPTFNPPAPFVEPEASMGEAETDSAGDDESEAPISDDEEKR